MLREYTLLTGSVLILATALIFAGTVLLGSSAPTPTSNRPLGPDPTTIFPHANNPEDISGLLVSISASAIVVKEDSGKIVTATIDSKTELSRPTTKKDPAAYHKELDDFGQKVQSGLGTFFPPYPFNTSAIAIGDISASEPVFVNADISSSSVRAVRILVGLPPQ